MPGIMTIIGRERDLEIAAAKVMNQHRRCLDSKCKDYPRYGARGIAVSSEWRIYAKFLADMGLAPACKTLDRIDNDGLYEFGNCRWATKQEQARNRRSNRLIEIGGVQKTLSEWAEFSGVNSSTIRMRLTRGNSEKSLLERVS